MAVRSQCYVFLVLKKMLYFDFSIDFFFVYFVMKSSLLVIFYKFKFFQFFFLLNGSLLEQSFINGIVCFFFCLKVRKRKGLILESKLFSLKLSSLFRIWSSGMLLEESVDQQVEDLGLLVNGMLGKQLFFQCLFFIFGVLVSCLFVFFMLVVVWEGY